MISTKVKQKIIKFAKDNVMAPWQDIKALEAFINAMPEESDIEEAIEHYQAGGSPVIRAMPEESVSRSQSRRIAHQLDDREKNQIARRKYQEWLDDDEAHDPYSIAGGLGANYDFLDWLDKGGE